MTDIMVRQGEQINLEVLNSKDQIDLKIEKSGGTDNYNKLIGKPKINGYTVEGEKVGSDYKLQDKMQAVPISEIEKILYLE